MPGKIIGLYVVRSPEVHRRRRIFRTYVPEQLDQGIYVGVCLQFRVIRILRISEWSDLVARELCANESYPAAVSK